MLNEWSEIFADDACVVAGILSRVIPYEPTPIKTASASVQLKTGFKRDFADFLFGSSIFA